MKEHEKRSFCKDLSEFPKADLQWMMVLRSPTQRMNEEAAIPPLFATTPVWASLKTPIRHRLKKPIIANRVKTLPFRFAL